MSKLMKMTSQSAFYYLISQLGDWNQKCPGLPPQMSKISPSPLLARFRWDSCAYLCWKALLRRKNERMNHSILLTYVIWIHWAFGSRFLGSFNTFKSVSSLVKKWKFTFSSIFLCSALINWNSTRCAQCSWPKVNFS